MALRASCIWHMRTKAERFWEETCGKSRWKNLEQLFAKRDKIIATQKEVRKLRDEKQDRVTAMRLEIRKILTPEQNEKLANSHWGRGPGFGPRGSMRGHDGHGREMEMCP